MVVPLLKTKDAVRDFFRGGVNGSRGEQPRLVA